VWISFEIAYRTRRNEPSYRFDRIWFDFLDQFGIVWARRIQDRINEMARREKWSVRLELDGFVDDQAILISTRSVDPAIETRIEHTTRWLLRRFVDTTWIDARIGANDNPISTPLSIDS
jgi:hypothetical protein